MMILSNYFFQNKIKKTLSRISNGMGPDMGPNCLQTCTDPESFVRGGPNLFFFFFKLIRGEAIQKAGHHRPASKTPFK